MSISLRGIRWLLPLTFAVAAIAIPAAQASPKPDARAALALHWQHEDALYGATQETSQARTQAKLMALHFQHEDTLYGARQETSQARTQAKLMAIHFKHEDALYGARELASSPPRLATTAVVAVSDGFDWSDALVGAGGAVALIILATATTIGLRRSHSRFAQS